MPGSSTLDHGTQGRLDSLTHYDEQFSDQEEGAEAQMSEAMR